VRCPGCKTEIEPGTKSCPNCGRLIVISTRDRLFAQSAAYTGVRHQQGKVLIDKDVDEDIKISTEEEDDSPYSDILKSRASIDVRGVGTEMDGTYHVASVRHEITDSDESEQSIRCPNCRTENEKKDKFCRNCGTRIPP
jgi:predicted RNA-binding Zn-ribbon protein involved in translation (DUF1610 family)